MIPEQNTPDLETVRLDRSSLDAALQERGLVVLAVGEHRANPEVLTVYLNGPSGQWANGTARDLIASVPGVIAVTESVPTPTILLVRVTPPGQRRRGGDAAG
ncbi:hypothetical protein KIH74_20080 [Kineosporia sp. J2-2]|uniref:BON domain-containing protein n=1 Tax=Kineosporia corallincola TaxID=2835133 RepID=A0ABS5TNT6_9ACTN|nr:hypothetical protein [Kineosporia corallincola]MBT0771249.1 hypothetical protein [Kineosporia corallincola]